MTSLAGLSSLGVPGVPWHTQILADQLNLFQPGGTDYAHLITTGTPGFSDLPTALMCSSGGGGGPAQKKIFFGQFFSTCEKITQFLEFCKYQGGKI